MTTTRTTTRPARKRKPARATPKETEAQFQATVIELAKRRGWLVTHTYDSRKTGPDKGFPDLCMVRNGRALFIELKTARGRIRPEQAQWIEALRECGVSAYVARPGDWTFIASVLL